MGFFNKLLPTQEEGKKEPSVSGRNLLNAEQIAAGRMIGPASQKEPLLIERWKELLKSNGINPTERLMGIAKYDLENFSGGKPMPQPAAARTTSSPPNQEQHGAADRIKADMADINLALEMTKLLKSIVLERAQDTAAFAAQINAMSQVTLRGK